MFLTDTAALHLKVEMVKRPGGERALTVVGVIINVLLGAFLSASSGGPISMKEIVITSIDSGEELVRGPVIQGAEWIADEMKRDLTRRTEAEWLARWGDPEKWHSNQ
jgi:hypothetical protein